MITTECYRKTIRSGAPGPEPLFFDVLCYKKIFVYSITLKVFTPSSMALSMSSI